ncbi:hypothetical protein [Streptomyces sp. JJ36]|uniref:hypothetical protein n=1 Tax=Streptomyces sp. JJ36 TaxID=2736645 RepID=UPI001F3C8950|nr:hypothetical protein [Streptomyces sp. JJ36]MCF6521527.1 hypothetical protein [Streptomyces sp. JJ36]
MDLRPELLPPPVDARRLARLVREIERIEDLLLTGDGAAHAAIDAFNAGTEHTYGASAFLTYAGSRTAEEFAREAARPAWPRVVDVTRAELAEVVRRALEPGPDSDYHLLLLAANVPHPRVGDLLFHPPEELADASPEELVEAALAYRPIAL